MNIRCEETLVEVRIRDTGHRLALVLLVVVATWGLGSADDALTLEAAIAEGLANSPDAGLAYEQIVQAQGRYEEVRARVLPQIKLTGMGSRTKISLGQLAAFGLPDSIAALPPLNQYQLQFEATQLLLAWGRIGNTIGAVREGLEDADIGIKQAERQVAFGVISAFYTVLAADAGVGVSEREEQYLAARLEQVRARQSAGSASRLELLTTTAEHAGVRPRSVEAKGALEVAEADFNRVIGRPLDANVTLEQSQDHQVRLPSNERATASARRSRLEFRRLDVQRGIQKRMISIDRNMLRPDLYAFGQYGAQAAPTPADIFDSNYYGWTVGVMLDFPLFVGLENRGKARRSQSVLRELELRTQKLEQSVEVEVTSALIAVRQTGEAKRAAVHAHGAAELAFSATVEAKDVGAATALDVLDARRRLMDAERMVSQARYAHLQAVAALKYAIGADLLAPLAP